MTSTVLSLRPRTKRLRPAWDPTSRRLGKAGVAGSPSVLSPFLFLFEASSTQAKAWVWRVVSGGETEARNEVLIAPMQRSPTPGEGRLFCPCPQNSSSWEDLVWSFLKS